MISSRQPSLPSISPALHHVFLVAGSVHCAAEATEITTVLGSCVAVCLWDRVTSAGGMNHYVLPRASDGEANPRYGVTAIDRLVEGMLALGSTIRTLEAKIFGGAAVLSAAGPEASVGSRNVQLALERLAYYGISITARRTGGKDGLWIRLFSDTGHVLIRSLAH